MCASPSAGVVIVGAGHAGAHAAFCLRDQGFDDSILLINGEPDAPYQRPPLSKAFLLGKLGEEGLSLKAEPAYRDYRIELLPDVRATAIDRVERSVVLSNGARRRYDALILATGARERALPLPGIGLRGVRTLRTLAQARALKASLSQARRLVIVGGGFIGLEFAAAARSLGLDVTVLERTTRVMMRAVAAETSAFVKDHHRSAGIAFRLDASIVGFQGQEAVASVHLSDGDSFAADLVLVGVGVEANDHLAREAGLATCDGVLVDAYLRTSDVAIYAIGDCARFPSRFGDGPVRIESVQNATDHARCVAANVMGAAAPYDATPWFWSDQGALKLQIAGLGADCDHATMRGATERGEFSVFRFSGGALRAVDSINRGADHVLARRLIANGAAISREQAADESLPLKALMPRG